jgi:hypothetical protein
MTTYKLSKNFVGDDIVLKLNADGSGASFKKDENNTDYQAYLAWLAEGNTPEPAEVTNG